MSSFRALRQISSAIHNRLTLSARRGSIGIGLIGIGGWGASNAVSIMRSRRYKIGGVYDIDQTASRRFGSRYDITVHQCLESLLASDAIGAVCITVPNHLHADYVYAAADAGKAVFVEKPLASSPSLCRELGQYCADKGVILQVGHQMRLEPVFRAMKRKLNTGDLGAPIYAHGVYTLPRQIRNDWRNQPELCPGGSMEQVGIHLVDVLMCLFGTPAASQGWSRNIPRQADGPEWGQVFMRFENNLQAAVSASFSTARNLELKIYCERGILSTDGITLQTSPCESGIQRERPRGVPGSVAQFLAFADSIETGSTPETGAAEAFAVMNVIQSVYHAGAPERVFPDPGVEF